MRTLKAQKKVPCYEDKHLDVFSCYLYPGDEVELVKNDPPEEPSIYIPEKDKTVYVLHNEIFYSLKEV